MTPQLTIEVPSDGRRFLLEIDAKLEGTAESQLFWSTKSEPGFAEDRSVRLSLSGQPNRWQRYRYYFNAGDDLTQLRFDPAAKARSLQIREIRLVRDTPAFQDAKLVDAQADFSQNEFSVVDAIDGKNNDNQDGWAVSPQTGKPHQAIFALKDPLESPIRKKLKVIMMQNFRGNKYSLGRFRVSVTSSSAPLDFGLPKSIQQILAIAPDERSQEQQEVLREHFRNHDGKMKELRGALANAKKPLPEDPEMKKREAKVATAKQPIQVDSALLRLRSYVQASESQVEKKRLTAAQDVAWALINSPAFLFNH